MKFTETLLKYTELTDKINDSNDNLRNETAVESLKDWSEFDTIDSIKSWFKEEQKNCRLITQDIPLLDCIGVMIGRIIKGILPFSPGRDHIHHKLQLLTNSSFKTLIGLLILGTLLAGLGIFVEKSYLSSETSFALFLIFAVIYYVSSSRIFKVRKIISN